MNRETSGAHGYFEKAVVIMPLLLPLLEEGKGVLGDLGIIPFYPNILPQRDIFKRTPSSSQQAQLRSKLLSCDLLHGSGSVFGHPLNFGII